MKISYNTFKNEENNEKELLMFYVDDYGENSLELSDNEYDELFNQKIDLNLDGLVFNIKYLSKSPNQLRDDSENIVSNNTILSNDERIFLDYTSAKRSAGKTINAKEKEQLELIINKLEKIKE
jgi:hypothetical protein